MRGSAENIKKLISLSNHKWSCNMREMSACISVFIIIKTPTLQLPLSVLPWFLKKGEAAMRNFSLNKVQLLPGDLNASQWNFPCLQPFVLLKGPGTRHVTVRAKNTSVSKCSTKYLQDTQIKWLQASSAGFD